MTRRLPQVHEAQQLARLRALRVQRARERIVPAQAECERAREAVLQRQRKIDQQRDAIAALRQAIVTSLAPVLPRWADVTRARHEHLADQLERNEYGLIQDERALEAAEEALQQARGELTRALAREDAVRGLVHDARRARTQAHEQRAEREMDDQIRPSTARTVNA
jgi:flagellar biosynthesis chaperone FliJ